MDGHRGLYAEGRKDTAPAPAPAPQHASAYLLVVLSTVVLPWKACALCACTSADVLLFYDDRGTRQKISSCACFLLVCLVSATKRLFSGGDLVFQPRTPSCFSGEMVGQRYRAGCVLRARRERDTWTTYTRTCTPEVGRDTAPPCNTRSGMCGSTLRRDHRRPVKAAKRFTKHWVWVPKVFLPCVL